MALQKSITLKNGATGNYLKINTLVLDKSLMKMTVALGLYADSTYAKPTFIAGTPATEETDSTPAVPAVPDKIIAPLALAQTFKTFSFNITKDQAVGDLLALGYLNILAKNDPDLTGAINA